MKKINNLPPGQVLPIRDIFPPGQRMHLQKLPCEDHQRITE